MTGSERLELLQHFREEAEEHAAAVSAALLAMEGGRGTPGLLEDVLRRVHSLKGAARVIGASAVEGLAGAIETVMGEVRAARLAPDGRVISSLLGALDEARALAGALAEGTAPAGGYEEKVSGLLSLVSGARGLDEELARRLPGLDPGVLETLTEFQKSRLVFACEAGKTCLEAELSVPAGGFAARVDALLPELKSLGELVSIAGLGPAPEGGLRFKFLLATRLAPEKVKEAAGRLSLGLADPAAAPEARPAPRAATPEEEAAEEAFARELARIAQQYVSEEYDKLDDLAKLVLSLERSPGDQELVNGTFRAAHNLKGAAATFGLQAVSRLAHQMETVVSALRGGKGAMTPRVTNALLRGVDALKELFAEARGGKLREDPPAQVMKELEGAFLAEPGPAAGAAAPAARAPSAAPRESIRVRLDKLDRLMNLADELTISRNTREAAVRDMEALADEAKSALRGWEGLREGLLALPQFRGGGLTAGYDAALARLGGLRDGLEDLWNRFGSTTLHAANLADALQSDVMRIRMVPVSTLFDSAPRIVRDLTADGSREARLEIAGGDTEFDKRVLELMGDPLMHLLRNAVDHGIEPPKERRRAGKPAAGLIRLSAEHRGGHITIEVRDDGRGLDPARLAAKAAEKGLVSPEEVKDLSTEQAYAFIFHPGFSTRETVTSVSGRGVGMDVVKSNVEAMKGRIEIESAPGRGTAFRIHLPLSVSVIQVIVAEAAGRRFCLQTDAVAEIIRVPESEVQSEDGKACVRHRGATVPVVRLSSLLGLGGSGPEPGLLVILVMKGLGGNIGFTVDRAVKEQTVVLKEIGRPFRRVPHVAGGTILDDGGVCVILDPASLVAAAVRSGGTWAPAPAAPAAGPARKSILVADDSLTTRELLRGLIESAGYSVTLARNGAEAWALLGKRRFDLVVSDVSMPEMDGCELTARIRADRRLARLPVVLVTSLAKEEERLKGLQAGADAYITKGAFDQNGLLERIKELAGRHEQ